MAEFDGRLLFWKPHTGSGKLVVGDAPSTGPVVPDADFSVDADFAEAAPDLRLVHGPACSIDAGFGDDLSVPADLELQWDRNVARPLLARARPHFQDAAPRASGIRSHWQPSQPMHAAHRPRWQEGRRAGRAARSHWQRARSLHQASRPVWQPGQPLQHALRGRLQQAIQLRTGARAAWQQAAPVLAASGLLRFQQCIVLRAGARSHFQPAVPLVRYVPLRLLVAQPVHRVSPVVWQLAMRPLPGITRIPLPEPERNLCYCPETLGRLVFERPFTGDGKLVFVCRPCVDFEPPEPPGPPGLVVVPILRSYTVLNELGLRLLDDTPIMADAFGMTLDDGSWTWSWQAAVPLWEEAKVRPTGGEPVEVVATLNGVDYRLLVESYQREREFGSGRIRLQGRGRAALLDAPYAAILDRANDSLITAEQLALAALDINGMPSGWALDWQLTDWTIPADTWALQGTPMAAILDIAGAAGGMVLPHKTAQQLRILPRYRAAPWDWSGLTPDFELPSAVVQVEGIEPTIRPAYDRVYVSGTTSDGILGQVTRTGQPGDVLLPMVTHPLITATEAATQRGLAELGIGGATEAVSLRLPVLPATGVIEPGAMVRYTDGPITRLGAVRGVSVDWRRPVLRQTLQLEVHP